MTWEKTALDVKQQDENPRLRLARACGGSRATRTSASEALQQIAAAFPDLWIQAQGTYEI